MRVQGMFVGPFLINFALAFVGAGGVTRARRNLIGAGSYVLSGAMILAYQAILLGGPDLVNALVAPLVPTLTVWLFVPQRDGAQSGRPLLSAAEHRVR